MKYIIRRPVLIGVSVYKKGDEIELEETEAKKYGNILGKKCQEEEHEREIELKNKLKTKSKNDKPKRLKRIPENNRKRT